MHTEDLCQLESSVVINPHYVVSLVEVLPNGSTIIDGNDKAFLIDNQDASYINSKRKTV